MDTIWNYQERGHGHQTGLVNNPFQFLLKSLGK